MSDTVSVHLTDVDLKAAVSVLSKYIDRPIVINNLAPTKVTLETPTAIRRGQVIELLRATLESQNLELVADSSGPYRIRAKEPPKPIADVPPEQQAGPLQLYVLHLRHARAADVAATVNALYGRASAFGEKSAPAPTLAQQLQQQNVPPGVAPPTPNAALLGQAATLSGETTIVPDAGTNSLFVRATRADFDLVAAAVKELDVRPIQVLIEVLIAEVRRDRELSFGVDVTLPDAHLPGHPNTTYAGSLTGLGGAGDAVLKVVGIGGDRDLAATLTAAASRGDVKIVSRPKVIAVNNADAVINVGSQRPFVQVSRSLPTDSPTRDQVVEYRDVGTKLTVKPTISTDGYVMLQVTQEVSSATSEVAFDAPVISTRSIQTQLLLKDGQTVVLGGLTDRQRDITQAGVPFLSSIPFLGGLFGRTNRHTTETELYLFITPKVMKTDEDTKTVTEPLMQRTGEQ